VLIDCNEWHEPHSTVFRVGSAQVLDQVSVALSHCHLLSRALQTSDILIGTHVEQ